MRISVIDAVRGFALLGILFVNMLDFSYPVLYVPPETFARDAFDRTLLAIVDIFAQASFYPLFSMLFGWGAFMMLDKGSERFRLTFARRLLALLAFGTVHAFFIWHGDILMTYALLGFFLYPFFRAQANTLRNWALAIWSVWAVGTTALMWLVAKPGDVPLADEHAANRAIANYGSGTLHDVWMQRWHDWLYVNEPINFMFYAFVIFPLFLFGAYVAKAKWFHDLDAHRRTIKKWCFVSLAVALIVKPLPYVYPAYESAAQYAQEMIGGPALALFYFTAFPLFCRRLTPVLAPVGKMALTNYLAQSLICTTLFYSYGFGLYGKLSVKQIVAFVLLLYGLQVAWSGWWLKTHATGPMEAIWRRFTYGKKKTT